jgi:hypothetical protein
MAQVDDVARFAAGDDERMVRASLACPYCLHKPSHVLVADHIYGGEAMCACSRCQTQWSVVLDADQVLRLRLAPPRDLWVQVQTFNGGTFG